jgi:hypothetical protein
VGTWESERQRGGVTHSPLQIEQSVANEKDGKSGVDEFRTKDLERLSKGGGLVHQGRHDDGETEEEGGKRQRKGWESHGEGWHQEWWWRRGARAQSQQKDSEQLESEEDVEDTRDEEHVAHPLLLRLLHRLLQCRGGGGEGGYLDHDETDTHRGESDDDEESLEREDRRELWWESAEGSKELAGGFADSVTPEGVSHESPGDSGDERDECPPESEESEEEKMESKCGTIWDDPLGKGTIVSDERGESLLTRWGEEEEEGPWTHHSNSNTTNQSRERKESVRVKERSEELSGDEEKEAILERAKEEMVLREEELEVRGQGRVRGAMRLLVSEIIEKACGDD